MKRIQKGTAGKWILVMLSLSLLFLASACDGTGSSGSEQEEEIADSSGLQEQQAEDVVLDPEALAASNTVFDPNVTDGETLFVSYCAKCHGLEGRGDGPSVGSLRDPSGMNLTIVQEKPDEELFNTITGGKGVEMPPWGLVLTEEQRHVLVDYVRSLASE